MIETLQHTSTGSVERRLLAFRVIGAAASLAMLTIAAFAKMPNYHVVAPAILIAIIWSLYALRFTLHLKPFHYALLCSALMLHMLGAFGYYQRSPLPFSYDILVHYDFALVGTLALHHALRTHFPLLRPLHLAVVTFFIMMGTAALHEIMEYCTYLALGEERGMLKPSTSYFFDTQRDLTNNLLGTLTALACIALARRKAPGMAPEARSNAR